MKLGSIGSSLVRLFRKSDTSVPPKIEGEGASAVLVGTKPQLDAIGELILKQLRESGVISADAEVKVSHVRPGIKPPIDGATEGWTWSQWSKESSAGGVIPGWAFCRFANRLGEESVGFVFGHVRGGFGVWCQPFDVCINDDEGVEQKPEILTCLTHLRTGMGIGIFADRAAAIQAAEIAESACPTWQKETDLGIVWRTSLARSRTAWHGMGIRESTNAHAHDQHGTRFPIFGQDTESVMAGKPERLS